jgi:hypothetical protein
VRVKTGTLNPDAFAASLVCAFAGDTIADYSNALNPSTPAKTLDVKTTTTKTTSYFKYYGASTYGGAIRFGTFATNVFASDYTAEGWYRSSASESSALLMSSLPGASGSQFRLGVQWQGQNPTTGPGQISVQRFGGAELNYGTYVVPAGVFFHFALTYTASARTYRAYVNGVLSLTVTWSTDVIGGTSLVLGGAGWTSATAADADTAGMFQDFRFYTCIKYTDNFTVL